MKNAFTDEEVELEIKRLTSDEDVQLAKAEHRMKYKRRQYLYTLRYLQKRGRELREAGVTRESLSEVIGQTEKDLDDFER